MLPRDARELTGLIVVTREAVKLAVHTESMRRNCSKGQEMSWQARGGPGRQGMKTRVIRARVARCRLPLSLPRKLPSLASTSFTRPYHLRHPFPITTPFPPLPFSLPCSSLSGGEHHARLPSAPGPDRPLQSEGRDPGSRGHSCHGNSGSAEVPRTEKSSHLPFASLVCSQMQLAIWWSLEGMIPAAEASTARGTAASSTL